MTDLDRDECRIEIHHIFPQAWCKSQGIAPAVFNSIVNKTAISYRANRMIGGKPPSQYLEELRTHRQVSIEQSEQNAILHTHLIDPQLLRSDAFRTFYEARKTALLALVEAAMGKSPFTQGEQPVPEDDIEGDEAEVPRPVISGAVSSRMAWVLGESAPLQCIESFASSGWNRSA